MNKWMINKIRTANVDNFTSNFGLKIRRKNAKLMSVALAYIFKKVYKKNVIVDRPLKLDKDKVYIFASAHNFCYESSPIAATIDRNSYLLFGGDELLNNESRILLGWISGMIYVDRYDNQSKKDSMLKMKRVLNAGNSILIFPEGKLNDSENKLCLKLFPGAYDLSYDMKVEVVPISVFNDDDGDDFYISYGEPLKLYKYEKKEGLRILRDSIATLTYEQIMNHSTPLVRENIDGDIRFNYMKQRMLEYNKVKWSKNVVWDLELFEYKAGDVDLEDVWKDIDKVNINYKNAGIFGDILVELEKRKKYSFLNYMKKNFSLLDDEKK